MDAFNPAGSPSLTGKFRESALAKLKAGDPAKYDFALRYFAGYQRAPTAEYFGESGNLSNAKELAAFSASPQGKLSSSLVDEGYAKGYITHSRDWLTRFDEEVLAPIITAVVAIGIGAGFAGIAGYGPAAAGGGGSGTTAAVGTTATGVSGSGLGGASGTVSGGVAPGAATTVEVAAGSTALPTSPAGIWPQIKEYVGTVKKGTEIVGALASTKLIVDSLTGKHKTITNSETVPPGWVVQDSAPAERAAAVQDSGQARASISQWVPLALVAAVLIGAR